MATAKAETKEIEVVVKTFEDIVTLELDENETKILYDILHRIGGSPHNSRRKYTEQIIQSMNIAGYGINQPDHSDMSKSHDVIYFTDTL